VSGADVITGAAVVVVVIGVDVMMGAGAVVTLSIEGTYELAVTGAA